MTVRKAAIVYLKQYLGELVSSGDLGLVVLNPTPIDLSNYYPYAWITNGADLERDLAGTRHNSTGSDHYVAATALIRLVGVVDDETLIEDLEDLIEVVINKIIEKMDSFRALTPKVNITGVQVVDDPDEDIQRDISIATIEVTYSG